MVDLGQRAGSERIARLIVELSVRRGGLNNAAQISLLLSQEQTPTPLVSPTCMSATP
jgi:hypothetical protein